jgi:hypothetical protein
MPPLCRLKCSGLCTLIGVEEKPGGREKANKGKKERERKRERKRRRKGTQIQASLFFRGTLISTT